MAQSGTVDKSQFELPVDDEGKSLEFRPFKLALGFIPVPHCGKRRTTNPHMRAFWAATLAFMSAFVGWFAFAPLLFYVRKDIGICDNNDFVQLDIENNKCVCKEECKTIINNANICAVSFDILTRFLLGSVIEKIGPANTDIMLLSWGALVVGCSALVTNASGLIAVRFFVSALGSTFVVNQFWNSIMFNRSVVGTANATAGGWGNLGGGITQLLMPAIYALFHDGFGLNLTLSWRMAMLVPASFYVCLATWIFFFTQDMPDRPGRFSVAVLGKTTRAGPATYLKCLMDYRVFLMIMQYGACFGCELVMNVKLALHFADNFDVNPFAAGAMAMTFGAMNLFARSLGGILSDVLNKRYNMSGRLWAHFVALFGQAVFLFLFGFMTKDVGVAPAIVVLAVFSIFVNMAEGTSYGIVPYMIPQELPVVSAMVGAGGTLGAPLALNLLFRFFDNFLSFKLYAGYIMFWAFTVMLMRWDQHGSMFSGPIAKAEVPSAEGANAETAA
jgi:NNP family nitrate/nitrite transporter-like MFS transporter